MQDTVTTQIRLPNCFWKSEQIPFNLVHFFKSLHGSSVTRSRMD